MGMASFNRARRVAAEKAAQVQETVQEVKEAPKKTRSRSKAKEGDVNESTNE